jgi:transposase
MIITLTSILRRVLPLKGFCYRCACWEEFSSQGVIEIGVESRKGARARCRCCQKPAPVYDTRSEPRRWRFISVWAIAVFLVYRPRRADCPRCGVHVEHLPWASGKLRFISKVLS